MIKDARKKIVVILGPTASGKSAIAVQLAKQFNGEVVSADSRQVYSGLNIGTGKITKREMKGVRHHLLDVANPRHRYSTIRFVKEATRAIRNILARGNTTILCGGTGFYLQNLTEGITLPNVPPNRALRQRLARKTPFELLAMLKKLDSKRAKSIDPHNVRRIIRAIEIAKVLGKVPKLSKKNRFETLNIGITLPREELKERIRLRLEKRMRQGMLSEARRLHRQGLSWKRMDELGLEYRYLALYLQKKLSLEEMIRKLNTEIWHYARRQLTWFKRDESITWFSPSEKTLIKSAVKRFLLS